jgi:hypothetical protein
MQYLFVFLSISSKEKDIKGVLEQCLKGNIEP